MLKPIGVRVNLSYVNHFGVPIKEHKYPTFIHLSDIYFVEDVKGIICEILNNVFHEVDFPPNVQIRWNAVDAVDELKGH